MRSGMRDMVDRSQVSGYLLLVCPDDAEEVACWTGDHTSSVRTVSTCHSVDGKVFYRRCGKDSFQVHGNDFFLTRDKE